MSRSRSASNVLGCVNDGSVGVAVFVLLPLLVPLVGVIRWLVLLVLLLLRECRAGVWDSGSEC